MSGIGGVYPSYEDHQLDKKKIGELFSDNFHEILYPNVNRTVAEADLTDPG